MTFEVGSLSTLQLACTVLHSVSQLDFCTQAYSLSLGGSPGGSSSGDLDLSARWSAAAASALALVYMMSISDESSQLFFVGQVTQF